MEQDKLEVVERINHHLKGEDVVDILKCFPIGSQSRVVASRSLGPKCSGSSNRNSLLGRGARTSLMNALETVQIVSRPITAAVISTVI